MTSHQQKNIPGIIAQTRTTDEQILKKAEEIALKRKREQRALRAKQRKEEQARKKKEAEERQKQWEEEQAIKREERRLKTIEFNNILEQHEKALDAMDNEILASEARTEQLKRAKRGVQRAFQSKCICPYKYYVEETIAYHTDKYCSLCLDDKDKWGWAGN